MEDKIKTTSNAGTDVQKTATPKKPAQKKVILNPARLSKPPALKKEQSEGSQKSRRRTMNMNLHFFTNLLPLLFAILCVLGTALFLLFLFRITWESIGATAHIESLRAEVVRETLQRARYDRIVDRIKKKTKERIVDWEKVKNPF